MIFIEGCKNYVKSLDIDRENIIKNSKISSLDVKTQVSALLSEKKPVSTISAKEEFSL